MKRIQLGAVLGVFLAFALASCEYDGFYGPYHEDDRAGDTRDAGDESGDPAPANGTTGGSAAAGSGSGTTNGGDSQSNDKQSGGTQVQPSLTVTAPASGAVYSEGQNLTVIWNASGSLAHTVRIELRRYGSHALTLAEEAPNNGSYDWQVGGSVGFDVEIQDEYQIRVIASVEEPNAQKGYASELEASSGFFTIIPSDSGLSDIAVDSRSITATFVDNGSVVDGDTVDIHLNGVLIADDHVLAAEPGTDMPLDLDPGENELRITAVNEGSVSPNTALIRFSNVITGRGEQEWRLAAGEVGTLTIDAP